MHWNNPRYEKRYNKLLTRLSERGFTIEDMQNMSLSNKRLKSKSVRLTKNYAFAFYLGMLYQIRVDDELEGVVTLS